MRSLLMKALVILSPLAAATAHASEPFVLTTEEYPPFNMTFQGQITGISTDLVRAVFDKAGVAYKIEMLPWSRAINMAETQKNTCVYSTTETEERKNRFEWIGPLTENNWVLFGKADQAPMQSLEEARGKTVGGYTGDAISLYLEKEGYKVETAPRDDLNLAKLINGRIDYWATGSELGPYLAQQQGAPGAIKPLLTFKKTVMSVACHKDSDPAALEKLRAALREARKN
jgi:polar amino acid transport system substrate-binding protein